MKVIKRVKLRTEMVNARTTTLTPKLNTISTKHCANWNVYNKRIRNFPFKNLSCLKISTFLFAVLVCLSSPYSNKESNYHTELLKDNRATMLARNMTCDFFR